MRRFPASPPIATLLLLAFVYMGGLGCSTDSTSPSTGTDCDTKIATARQVGQRRVTALAFTRRTPCAAAA